MPAAQGLADLGQVGVWVTVNRVAKEPTEKHRLAKKFQAIAVEMESYAVADVCRERELPFVAVRSISDTYQQSLPPHLDRVMQQGSATARAGRALGTLMRQPSAAADFCRLYAVAREAADNLARGLVQIAHRLPDDDDDRRR